MRFDFELVLGRNMAIIRILIFFIISSILSSEESSRRACFVKNQVTIQSLYQLLFFLSI
jgi:hypothetical protein